MHEKIVTFVKSGLVGYEVVIRTGRFPVQTTLGTRSSLGVQHR